MPWARAASISFLTFGTIGPQRGRAPKLAFIRSSTSSAVVLGSTVTGLSWGGGGSFTLDHSAMMSLAPAGGAANEATAASSAAPQNCLPWIMIVSLAWAEPARLAPLGWRRRAVDQRRSKAPHQYAWHGRKDHQQSRVQEWVLGEGQRDPAGVDPVG